MRFIDSPIIGPEGVGLYLRRTRTAAASFVPTDVSGCVIWLKADAGLYDATVGGSAVAADGTVARWEDQSGSGNHFTQANVAAQPILKTGIINSLPVVRFDGSDDVLKAASSLSLTHNSVFVVVRPLSSPGDYDPAFISGNSWSRICIKTNSTQWGTFAGSPVYATTSLSTNTAYLLAIVHQRSVLTTMYLNSSSEGTFNATMNGAGGSDAVGAETGASRFANVDIAELIVYDSAIAGADLANVFAYLNGRYALY